MAMQDNATLLTGTIRYYTAPVGTDAPDLTKWFDDTDRETELAAWTELGHTNEERPYLQTFEGGETETKGSLQNSALRTQTSDRKTALEVDLKQFDTDSIKYFLGANAVASGGWQYAQLKPKPIETAILAVFEDDESVFGSHAHKATVTGNGDFEVADIEELDKLPLKFSALQMDGKPGYFGWHPLVVKQP